MTRKILLFCLLFLALPFWAKAQQPSKTTPGFTLEVDKKSDPKPAPWELYGGTAFVSAIVYNNGRIAYRAPAQRLWFGGEKPKSERLIFFVEAGVYKRLTANEYHDEGGDEAELKLGIKGRAEKFEYEVSGGFRKVREEHDALLVEAQLTGPKKTFANNNFIAPFIRFVGESPASTEGGRKSAVAVGGISYAQAFPSRRLSFEASLAILGGTGIEEHKTVARTDLLVMLCKWKGSDHESSRFAVKPFVRLTGSYVSGGLGIFFGKVK